MDKAAGKRQTDAGTERRPRLAPLAVFVLFSWFLLLAGCNTAPKLPGGDPLLGGGAPLPRNPGKTGPGPVQGTAGTGQGATGQPQAATVPPLPGIPTSGTRSSPAALAPGKRNPFDRNRDLQIDDWPRSSQGLGGGWTAPASAGRSNGSGVTLRPPEPVADTGSFPAPAPSVPAPPRPPDPAPGSGNPNLTYEQLIAQLQVRGVVYQKPEQIGSEWQFTCAVRNPQNPSQQRVYQARGRELLEAMQAVVQQIDRDVRP